MAITIHKQAQQLQPVYNEIVYVISSTLSSQENFNFIGIIKVDGVALASITFPVNPEGYGVFDIHKHLQTVVSNDFNPEDQGFVEAINSYVNYDVELYESFRPNWEFIATINHIPGGPIPGPPYQYNITFINAIGGPDPNEYFSVGDTILVVQQGFYDDPSINGVATILSMSYDSIADQWMVEINKPYTQLTTGVYGGYITTPNFQLYTSDNPTILAFRNAFNGVRKFEEFIDWDYDEYNANKALGLSGKWLTNVPSPYNIRFNSNIWLDVYSNKINEVNYLKIETTLGTYFMANPYTAGGEYLFKVNVSPQSLNQQTLLNPDGSEATQPIFLGVDECYSVSIVEELNSVTPNIIPTTFCITSPCTRYEDIQLVFMDKLGSFIPFHFNLVNKHTKSIERVNYQTDYGKYASASNVWTYNDWDRGTRTLDTRVNDEYQITSDWIDQETSDFLMTLFESPEVYWFKEDGTVLGINLTVSSVERKQVINDQLINYTLTFELSNKNKQQIG